MPSHFTKVKLCWLRLLRTVGGSFERTASYRAPFRRAFVDLGTSLLCKSCLTLSMVERISTAQRDETVRRRGTALHGGLLWRYACHHEMATTRSIRRSRNWRSHENVEDLGKVEYYRILAKKW